MSSYAADPLQVGDAASVAGLPLWQS